MVKFQNLQADYRPAGDGQDDTEKADLIADNLPVILRMAETILQASVGIFQGGTSLEYV